MSKKLKCNKTYLHFLKIILERELREKDFNEVDLDLCRSNAKSVVDFLNKEKEPDQSNPKLLLEDNCNVRRNCL